ncbi:unnamed protein product [Timema podura]|uniref:Uncharacterized protein n=1 Tax=Timema podura TaxID=61482 RepID=A0ABN7P9F9_TIMPD|nr:unnamed protein product [Timema podura]
MEPRRGKVRDGRQAAVYQPNRQQLEARTYNQTKHHQRFCLSLMESQQKSTDLTLRTKFSCFQKEQVSEKQHCYCSRKNVADTPL